MVRGVDGAVDLDVLVQPRASRAKVGPEHDGRLKIAVTAPPVDGEANAAVTELIAKQLGIARGAVAVVAGETSRRKTVRIAAARSVIELWLAPLLMVWVAVTGCQGTVGTVDVTLAVSPGSTLLDGVETVRLTLTNPPQTATSQRSPSGGFAIDLQLDATNNTGSLIVDGLDANGTTIATGATPPFPFGGVAANIVIFLAAPNSISTALVNLDPPRTELASVPVSYGAVFVGGALGDGTPSAVTAIYNAFDHAFQVGVVLPAAKSAVALAVGTSGNYVYVFGGTDATGAPSDTVQRFDTSVAPAGSISDFGAFAGFARTGQTALSIGNENILVTGTPVAELSGTAVTVTARPDIADLPPSGAAVTANDGVATAIFAGAAGVTRYRNNVFDALDVASAARDGAVVVALAGGTVGVVCGAGDLVRIDAATGTADTFSIPSATRTGCAVAATTRHLVIAGGTNAGGDLATTAEIYDAGTLALIATQPLAVPRTGATATALPNGQIMIAGGVDAMGAPIGTLELFTPDSQ